ncbi:hypothetical protein C1H46_008568 [Malus baccata]|uniref:Uncharacterized protein n=1 Tax=Malus baccata TaxID=106549 RepID=A0A540N4B6_MALBA|nr:hypothetical protein C1H46_008568 [Malus baccata]
MEEDGGKPPRPLHPTCFEALSLDPRLNPQSMCPNSTLDPSEDNGTNSKTPPMNQTEIFRALEVVKFNAKSKKYTYSFNGWSSRCREIAAIRA